METELAVVGGGPGGYVAAIRAAQLGVETTLIERDTLGGVCLSAGCIPSKALLSATGVARRAEEATGMGVDADPTVDPTRMVEWQSEVVGQLTGGVGRRCRDAGVDVVEGTARFVDDRTLSLVDGAETIAFEDAVVATGSRPIELPGLPFADGPVWSSREALAVETVPDRLVVVGAGYVGLELATVFARLGSSVTVLEALDRPLPGFEADLGRYVRRSLLEEGVEFEFGHAVEGYRETGGGIEVLAEAEGENREFPADRVLVAVGREPVTDTVAIGNAGVEPEDGFLPVDEQCRIGDGLFAVGDVAGEPMLAHKAMLEGRVAAETVAGEPASRERAVPAAVYTDPEVATVGLTEDGARESGHDPVVGEFRLGASGRALTENRPVGLVRVVADGDSGRVLGGAVVASHASELIAELTLAVQQSVTLVELGGTVHAHPTVAEAVGEAAEQALGRAIHTGN